MGRIIMIIPYIMENKKCLKPATRISQYTDILRYYRISLFNGHFRNLNCRYLPYIRIYKAYVRPMQGNIPAKYGPIWYSTSILGSWNSHWFIGMLGHILGIYWDYHGNMGHSQPVIIHKPESKVEMKWLMISGLFPPLSINSSRSEVVMIYPTH